MNALFLTLTALVILYFLLGWVLSYTTDKYSWIDFFWSSSFFIPIVALTLKAPSAPLTLLSLLMLIWSIRLSLLLFKRIKNKSEDPRYTKLKHHWGKKSALHFLLMYLFEALLTLTLCLPLYLSFISTSTSISKWNLAGALLFGIAFIGEVISDQQMLSFKKNNKGQKKVCNIGLWKYSRHPNYFFELLTWLSYGIFNLGSQHPLLGFLPFALMCFFIIKITGIPHAEEQAIATRGDLYREYQRTTSALIPWFPKENK